MRIGMRSGKHAVRHLVVAGVTVCAVLGMVFILFHTKEEVPTGTTATYVPDFSFPDASGEPVVLDDLVGEVRVINFWASWSPYSKDELPALVALKREFGDRIAIVALNRDTTPSDGRAFLASLGLGEDLLFAYDREDGYFKEVGGYNMPETIFVGPEGQVLHHVHGPMMYEDMKRVAEGLLNVGEQ